jgi:hypothetical protein
VERNWREQGIGRVSASVDLAHLAQHALGSPGPTERG